jgi:hypothetical protein
MTSNAHPQTTITSLELESRHTLIDALSASFHCTRCQHRVDLPEPADAIATDHELFRSTIEMLHWICFTGSHQGYERFDLCRIVTASVRGLTQVDDLYESLHSAIGVERVEFKRALECACRNGLLFRPTPNWVQPIPQQRPTALARTTPSRGSSLT